MKQYAKLCGYFAEWLWKPFCRIVIAVCILELLIAASQAEWCGRYAMLLDETALLLCGRGALALFLFAVWRCFHRFYGAYRGIYTLAALPAPGWAFPAAAYTVTAAGVLVLNAVQLVMALAAYIPFYMRHGAGEGLYLAILRSEQLRNLLPHALAPVLRAMLYFNLAMCLPFVLMPASFRKRFRWRGPVSDQVSLRQSVLTLSIFLMIFVSRNDPLARYLFWDVLILAGLVLDLRDWATRPGQIELF